MTKLRNETKKVEEAIAKLDGELKALNKEKVQKEITSKQELIKTLEELLENEDIQKRYPKYNRIKKLFNRLPSLITLFLTIALIIAALLVVDVTFKTFVAMIIIAADYVVYQSSSFIFSKMIDENEKYKPFFELYNNKNYSAKRALTDLHLAEEELKTNNQLLNECSQKEKELQKFQGFLAKLNDIRDNYVEHTLPEEYSKGEIDEIAESFYQAMNPIEEKPRTYVK